MARRTRNPRLVKVHRNYSVEEAARLLSVHKNTVRGWIRQGLPTVDRQRPTLVLGRELADFLASRRQRNKRPCAAGQIYCVRCRMPQYPAGDMADYLPLSASSGNLMGICPGCEGLMYRRVSLARLEQARGALVVRQQEARQHTPDEPKPADGYEDAWNQF